MKKRFNNCCSICEECMKGIVTIVDEEWKKDSAKVRKENLKGDLLN